MITCDKIATDNHELSSLKISLQRSEDLVKQLNEIQLSLCPLTTSNSSFSIDDDLSVNNCDPEFTISENYDQPQSPCDSPVNPSPSETITSVQITQGSQELPDPIIILTINPMIHYMTDPVTSFNP